MKSVRNTVLKALQISKNLVKIVSIHFKITSLSRNISLLNFNNNDPYLIKISPEENVYILSSYLSQTWSDIHVKGIFIPLLVRLFQSAGLQVFGPEY